MVEVSPGKGQIQVKTGYLFFALACIVLFSILFYLAPGTGWPVYALWTAVIIALVIEIKYFSAPAAFAVLLIIGIAIAALVKKYAL